MADKPIPKAEWARGSWDDEPDALDWRDERTGLECSIVRTPMTGALCGYVGVPPGHPFFGWHYHDKIPAKPEDLEGTLDDVGAIPAFIYAISDDAENGTIDLGMALKAHGGIGYAGGLPGASAGPRAALWCFGFDCAHAGDVMPALEALLGRIMPPEHIAERKRLEAELGCAYRTIEYVKAECTRLAFQLRQLETRMIAVDMPAIPGVKTGEV